MVRKIKPTFKQTSIFYGKQKVWAIGFPLKSSKHPYTIEDIRNLAKKQLSKYEGKGMTAMMGVLPNEGKGKWLNASSFKIDSMGTHGMPIHNEMDSDNLVWKFAKDFNIYIWGNNNARGGDDIHNDCLFKCIREAINYDEIPEGFKPEYKFKRRLKLERDDKVPLNKLPILEERFKVNFNVCGDKTFISSNKYQKTVNLKLVNEHFTLVHNNQKTKVLLNGFQFKEQKLILFEKQDEMYITYDGNEKQVLDKETFSARDKLTNVYQLNDSKQDIEEYYNNIMKNVQILKDKSNGLINLKKCMYKCKTAVLKNLYDTSKGIENPEEITELEEHYLANFSGAIMFSEKCELENAYQYDINSAYAYYLMSNAFKIPMKQGTFMKLTELPEILQYGMYRCKISKNKSFKYLRLYNLFRFREDNLYTHFDIKSARKLNLNIELIVDDESNALIYGAGTCVNGCKIFKTMITNLYKLKQEKVPYIKEMMIRLWGSLCEKHTVKHIVVDNELHVPDGSIIRKIHPVKNGFKIEYSEYGNMFKLNYARFAPFLTSAVRLKLVELVLPNIDNVYRVFTDSILSDKPLTNLKIGTEIGDWKLEKQGKCIIEKNNKKPIWI
jgi:hypothetical protein